jgi:hypothetical protein
MRRGEDSRRLLEEPLLLRIAEKYGKSPAQVRQLSTAADIIRRSCNRWCSDALSELCGFNECMQDSR